MQLGPKAANSGAGGGSNAGGNRPWQNNNIGSTNRPATQSQDAAPEEEIPIINVDDEGGGEELPF